MSKGPGKSHRKGMSITEMVKMFPDSETAEQWFVQKRWNGQPQCPCCGSRNVQTECRHKTMPYRCREKNCRKKFSVKTGTVMQGSNLDYQIWAIAMYNMVTGLKGVASMKLHHDVKITQKSAWHLAHRIREGFRASHDPFSGPVEADETYMGGLEKNKHHGKKRKAGRGGVGKAIVVGARDRETNKVTAKVVQDTRKETLHEFVEGVSDEESTVYTDENKSYRGIGRKHETVNHSAGQYVKKQVHTNGIESFWSMLERAHKGTYHKFSKKHLQRYVTEFAGRHNARESDTIDQMAGLAADMAGKRLRYRDLIADNGLDNGARRS